MEFTSLDAKWRGMNAVSSPSACVDSVLPFLSTSYLHREGGESVTTSLGIARSSPADIRHFDLGKIGGFGGADFRIAVGSGLPDRGNSIGDLPIGSSTPQQLSQVISLSGKKTGIEKTVGR